MLISISWLLMTEMHAYLEDVDGAGRDKNLLLSLSLRLAELAFEIDARLRGDVLVDEQHRLPLLLEYGLSDLAAINSDEVVAALALSSPSIDVANELEELGSRLSQTYIGLLEHFPGKLVNTLLPDSQGQTLRTLRTWDKTLRKTGADPSFLAPLMRAL